MAVPSQAQALLNMAKAIAKMAYAIEAGARHPSPWDIELGRSLPQEVAGRRTSDNSPPSTLSAPLPPKSRYPWNPEPSALAAPLAHDTDLRPRPSAQPFKLLMEEGYFDGMTGNRPTYDTPPPRDKGGPDWGHARMTPLGAWNLQMKRVYLASSSASSNDVASAYLGGT
jgi:hypothetical protein